MGRYIVLLLLTLAVALIGAAFAVEQPDTLTIQQSAKDESVYDSGRTPSVIYLPIFVAGLVVGVVLMLYHARRVTRGILSSEWTMYLERQQQGSKYWLDHFKVIEALKASKDDMKKTIDHLKNLVAANSRNQSSEPVIFGRSMVSNPSDRLESDTAASHLVTEWQSHSIKNEGENKRDELFFSIPESDGSFNIGLGTSIKSHDCFYRIQGETGQIGKLYFISGEYDGRALDNIDAYLNPVCEIENIEDRIGARRIIVTRPGQVVRNGDFWKIEEGQKVKIRLA